MPRIVGASQTHHREHRGQGKRRTYLPQPRRRSFLRRIGGGDGIVRVVEASTDYYQRDIAAVERIVAQHGIGLVGNASYATGITTAVEGRAIDRVAPHTQIQRLRELRHPVVRDAGLLPDRDAVAEREQQPRGVQRLIRLRIPRRDIRGHGLVRRHRVDSRQTARPFRALLASRARHDRFDEIRDLFAHAASLQS